MIKIKIRITIMTSKKNICPRRQNLKSFGKYYSP